MRAAMWRLIGGRADDYYLAEGIGLAWLRAGQASR
jgi:hypothetical protein